MPAGNFSPLKGTHSGKCAATLVLAAVVFGCSSVDKRFGDDPLYRKAQAVSVKVADVTVKAASKAADATGVAASKAYKKYQQYLAKEDLMKTYNDHGGVGKAEEKYLLQILRDHGLFVARGASKPHKGASPGASAPAVPAHVPERYTGQMRWPLDAFIVSSPFGERWGKQHKGMDLAADSGEPVYAVAAGQVIYAGDGLRGYGNVVILRHDQHKSSLYAHNRELKVKQGDQVAQGAVIALLGSTGHSTGPHVHFEVRDGEAPVNPASVLPKPPFMAAALADRDRRVVAAH